MKASSVPSAALPRGANGRAKCSPPRANPSKNARATAKRAAAANSFSCDPVFSGGVVYFFIGCIRMRPRVHTIYSIGERGFAAAEKFPENIPKKVVIFLKKCLTKKFIRANICKLSRKTACFFP